MYRIYIWIFLLCTGLVTVFFYHYVEYLCPAVVTTLTPRKQFTHARTYYSFIHLQTSSEEHFQSQQFADNALGKSQRHRVRLYPSNTELILQQINRNTIDYEHWYPLYRYNSTFNMADTLPDDSSSGLI